MRPRRTPVYTRTISASGDDEKGRSNVIRAQHKWKEVKVDYRRSRGEEERGQATRGGRDQVISSSDALPGRLPSAQALPYAGDAAKDGVWGLGNAGS